MPRKKNSKKKNVKKPKVEEEIKPTRAEIIAKKKESVQNFVDYVKSELCDKMDGEQLVATDIIELHNKFDLVPQEFEGKLYCKSTRRKLREDHNIIIKYLRKESGETLVSFFTKAK